MPTPNTGEKRSDFVSRCIPVVLNDGTAQSQSQAVAVCNSIWERRAAKSMFGNKNTIKSRAVRLEGDPQNVIEAAISEGDGEGKLPRIRITANTGRPMRLDGFGDPVIIDLSGVGFRKAHVPILADHENRLSARLGHSTNQTVGDTIEVDGVISASTEMAQGIVADAKNGLPFESSVGATINRGRRIAEGEKAVINGTEWEGPFIHAQKVTINEFTLTMLGADDATSVDISATRKSGDRRMVAALRKWIDDNKDFVASLGYDVDDIEGIDDEGQQRLEAIRAFKPTNKLNKTEALEAEVIETPAQYQQRMRAAAAEESERQETINALAIQYDIKASDKVQIPAHIVSKYDGMRSDETTFATFKKNAIRCGMSVEHFEIVAMRAERGAAPAIHSAAQFHDLSNKAIEAAIVRSVGNVPASKVHATSGEKWGWEHWYKPETLEASDSPKLRNLTLKKLLDQANIQANRGTKLGEHGDSFIVETKQSLHQLRASSGYSTWEGLRIFEDVANKFLWSGYQSQNTVWEQIARRHNVNDFKTHNLYRLTWTGGYGRVGASGELEHGSYVDQRYQVTAETFGKLVGITRKDIINDDLGALERVMSGLGIESARGIEELVLVHLMSNLLTLFPTNDANNNYVSGANTAVSVDGYTEVATKFSNQIDEDGAPILIRPDRVLVGTNNQVRAAELHRTTTVTYVNQGGTGEKFRPDGNPHVGAYMPISTPYMNNSNLLQRLDNVKTAIPNQSDTHYIMMSDPQSPEGGLLIIGLLNGASTPTLQSSDADFNLLGMQWRGYHDAGVGNGDPRLAVYSKGAA